MLKLCIIKKLKKNKNGVNSLGIDLGVNNLASITSDNGLSLIVNGRNLKSINQYYNKELARLHQQYSVQNIKKGKKLWRLNLKRNNKVKDYLHKVSHFITHLCVSNQIGQVFVGHNKSWKQEVNIGKKNNQNFVQIPFSTLINMLRYKLEENNINLIELNEAYTSKCSFLDNEDICKHEAYCGKRIKRGLFSSNKGLINADINGSLNILRRGLNKTFEVCSNVFNPIKKTINESTEALLSQVVEAKCRSHIVKNKVTIKV